LHIIDNNKTRPFTTHIVPYDDFYNGLHNASKSKRVAASMVGDPPTGYNPKYTHNPIRTFMSKRSNLFHELSHNSDFRSTYDYGSPFKTNLFTEEMNRGTKFRHYKG
jgi:hypothetical protein